MNLFTRIVNYLTKVEIETVAEITHGYRTMVARFESAIEARTKEIGAINVEIANKLELRRIHEFEVTAAKELSEKFKALVG